LWQLAFLVAVGCLAGLVVAVGLVRDLVAVDISLARVAVGAGVDVDILVAVGCFVKVGNGVSVKVNVGSVGSSRSMD